MKIQSFDASDRGLFRDFNEDACYADDSTGLYIVADGLGGLQGGELASHMAIEIFLDIFESEPKRFPHQAHKALQTVNDYIVQKAQDLGYLMGIGTTFTMGQIVADQLHITHIGDTAILLYREGGFQQLTSDHTQEESIRLSVAPGQDIYIHEEATHCLTRCIGQIEPLRPQLAQVTLQAKDRILFISDGVTKTIFFKELHSIVLAARTAKGLVQEIVATANARGGPDNTTAIALFVE